MTTQRYERIPQFTQGDRLRKSREEAGFDQQGIADAIGVSRSTITNAEKQHHGVRKITLNAWALATGVPVEWLEHGTEPGGDGPTGGQTSAPYFALVA